jgi:hypothetical protein
VLLKGPGGADDDGGEGARPLPPPYHQAASPISPELALVDRELADFDPAWQELQPFVVELPDGSRERTARDALIRICELSDVNPPRTRRLIMLAVAVPALLWIEALLLVASFVPFNAL